MWMSVTFEHLLAGLPLPVSELLRTVGALPPVPGPTAPPLPGSISTTTTTQLLRYHVAMYGTDKILS